MSLPGFGYVCRKHFSVKQGIDRCLVAGCHFRYINIGIREGFLPGIVNDFIHER